MRGIAGSQGANRIATTNSGLDLGYQCLGGRSNARKKAEFLSAVLGELRIVAASVFVKRGTGRRSGLLKISLA